MSSQPGMEHTVHRFIAPSGRDAHVLLSISPSTSPTHLNLVINCSHRVGRPQNYDYGVTPKDDNLYTVVPVESEFVLDGIEAIPPLPIWKGHAAEHPHYEPGQATNFDAASSSTAGQPSASIPVHKVERRKAPVGTTPSLKGTKATAPAEATILIAPIHIFI